jgi:hypothetical protein
MISVNFSQLKSRWTYFWKLAGSFAPLSTSIELLAAKLPDRAAEVALLHTAAIAVGGVAWLLAIYAGPGVSLLRSPFPHSYTEK